MTTEPSAPRADRPAAEPVLHACLLEQAARLRAEPAWRSGDRNAITLLKTPALSLVLLAIRGGARLHEHRAEGPLTVQVLSGAARVQAGGRRVDLGPGEVLVLEPGLPHALEALQESVVLLTIAGGAGRPNGGPW